MPETKVETSTSSLGEKNAERKAAATTEVAKPAASEVTHAQPTKAAEATAAATKAAEDTKSYVFDGVHYPNAVVRQFTDKDPSNPARTITTRKRFDMITHLLIQRVSGMGTSQRTGEKYITLSGQYGPFSTARITASAQNADAVLAFLKGKVDKTHPDLPLKERLVVDVIGTPMSARRRGGNWNANPAQGFVPSMPQQPNPNQGSARQGGFGFTITELYEVLPNGDKKVIIGAPTPVASEAGQVEEMLL